MGKHIVVHGFGKNYTWWICHGEAHRAREEVLRQRIETFDAEAECGDTIEDFHQGNFDEGPDQVMDEAPEETAKAYYNMLSSAQKPLHKHTDVSQLDGIVRLMALKCKFGISRDRFNEMLVVIGTLLPKEHSLRRAVTRHKNSFMYLRCHMRR
jgi:beta-N-acetylglucosaminidase